MTEAVPITPEIPLDAQDIAARLSLLLIAKYHVLRLIGVGGMASVYLVRHRIHHGLFAVKVLHPALAEQPHLLARFRREGLFSARLAGHPNIAPVLDVGEGDGLHYLLMPYIRGEDLDHILARTGAFPFDDALIATLQVNDALLYAWSNGILHGDLTPGNIRLNEFGQFILVDFGLASDGLAPRPAAPQSTSPPPGTPLYMSPERILGKPIDIRSDLYALGAILYELLTGEAAFGAENLAQGADTLAQIERNHLEPRHSLAHPKFTQHPGVQPLLQTLLALSPDKRFADPLQLQQALRSLAVQSPSLTIHPHADPTVDTIPPPRRLLSLH